MNLGYLEPRPRAGAWTCASVGRATAGVLRADRGAPAGAERARRQRGRVPRGAPAAGGRRGRHRAFRVAGGLATAADDIRGDAGAVAAARVAVRAQQPGGHPGGGAVGQRAGCGGGCGRARALGAGAAGGGTGRAGGDGAVRSAGDLRRRRAGPGAAGRGACPTCARRAGQLPRWRRGRWPAWRRSSRSGGRCPAGRPRRPDVRVLHVLRRAAAADVPAPAGDGVRPLPGIRRRTSGDSTQTTAAWSTRCCITPGSRCCGS